MTDDPVSNDMKAFWQNHAPKPVRMSPGELRKKAEELQRTVLWRNLREYVTAALVIVINGYYFWKFHAPVLRLGSGLIVTGLLYIVYQLHRRGSARTVPMEMALNTVDFHRRELERQRDLLRTVWTWYLLPLAPGMILFLIGLFKLATEQQPARHGVIALVFGVFAAGCSGVFVLVERLNQRAVRKIQRQIDTLDALTKEL